MNATQLLENFDRLAEAPNAVPRLRRFILDLAVRGKLVAQEAGDEPATELIKQIEAEKGRLARAGIAGKQEAFEPIHDADAAFPIPTAWIWAPATFPAYIVSDLRKKVQTKDVLQSGEFPVVDQGKVFIRGYCNDQDKVIRVATPLILFGDHTRETKLIDFDFIVGADGVKLLQPVCLFTRYYFLALQWLPLNSRGYGRHFKLLKSACLPLPPLAEQHRIVAKVDELMAVCDQLEAAQQERERRRDRLATASLQRLNQPTADTKPEARRDHARFHFHHLPRLTTRPEHIKAMRQLFLDVAICRPELSTGTHVVSVTQSQTLRLDALAKIVRGSSPRPKNDPKFYGGTVPRLRIADITRDGKYVTPRIDTLTEAGALLSRPMKEGSLVLAISGTYGLPAFLAVDACIHDGFIGFRDISKSLDLEYLYLVLIWRKPYFDSVVKDSGLKNLTTEHLKQLTLPVPSLAVQRKIVAKVDELMALCDQLEAQLATTQTDSRRLLEAVLDAALVPA